MVDWLEIKTEYIHGAISLRKLAEKRGVSYSQLAKVAAAEKWSAAKESQRIIIEAETNQRAVEKIAETESEIAAIKSRINLRLMQMIEAALPTIEAADTDRLRKVVQSYKDMCELKGNQDGGGDIGTGVVMMPEVIPFE